MAKTQERIGAVVDDAKREQLKKLLFLKQTLTEGESSSVKQLRKMIDMAPNEEVREACQRALEDLEVGGTMDIDEALTAITEAGMTPQQIIAAGASVTINRKLYAIEHPKETKKPDESDGEATEDNGLEMPEDA